MSEQRRERARTHAASFVDYRCAVSSAFDAPMSDAEDDARRARYASLRRALKMAMSDDEDYAAERDERRLDAVDITPLMRVYR